MRNYRPEAVVNTDYLYGLFLWGGFFNTDCVNEHKVEPAMYEEKTLFFKEKETRDNILKSLQDISEDLANKGFRSTLMSTLSEGYNINTPVICHRVSEYKGKRVLTRTQMQPGTTIKHAMYHMDNKWYPGFNDYPFGYGSETEDIYSSEDFIIIQEWVSGAFDLKDYQGE